MNPQAKIDLVGIGSDFDMGIHYCKRRLPCPTEASAEFKDGYQTQKASIWLWRYLGDSMGLNFESYRIGLLMEVSRVGNQHQKESALARFGEEQRKFNTN
jgi:hypothetical protein